MVIKSKLNSILPQTRPNTALDDHVVAMAIGGVPII